MMIAVDTLAATLGALYLVMKVCSGGVVSSFVGKVTEKLLCWRCSVQHLVPGARQRVHVRAGRVLRCPAVETPLPLGRAVLVRPQKVEAGELVKVEAMADLFRVLLFILAVSIHDSGV